MLKNRFLLTADRNTVYINEWLDTLVSMRGDLINTNEHFYLLMNPTLTILHYPTQTISNCGAFHV